MLERMDMSSSQLLSTWCKLVSFVERHMKMRVHISNTSGDLQHFHYQRSN
jgi:hypothetical protein